MAKLLEKKYSLEDIYHRREFDSRPKYARFCKVPNAIVQLREILYDRDGTSKKGCVVSGSTVYLDALYEAVVAHGGFENVCSSHLWGSVAMKLQLFKVIVGLCLLVSL
jgi:hypothetical protein